MIRKWMARKVFEWCRKAYFGNDTFAKMKRSVPGVRDMSYDQNFNDLHIIIRGKPNDEWKRMPKVHRSMKADLKEAINSAGPAVLSKEEASGR